MIVIINIFMEKTDKISINKILVEIKRFKLRIESNLKGVELIIICHDTMKLF